MCLIGLRVLGYLASVLLLWVQWLSIGIGLSGYDLTRSLIIGIKGTKDRINGDMSRFLLSHNCILGKVAPRC